MEKNKNKWTKITGDNKKDLLSLPLTNIPVFVLTKNKQINVCKTYIPTDCYGNNIGSARWKGSTSFCESIIAWMYPPDFDYIFNE